MGSDWKAIVADKKRRQLESIPREWIIPAPSEEVVDVTRYPEECGLLNSKDIEITNTDVDGLLKKLAAGKWSSVEVTRAFYKRAIIAHQLVSFLPSLCRLSWSLILLYRLTISLKYSLIEHLSALQ